MNYLNLLSNKSIRVKFPDREEKTKLKFRTFARQLSDKCSDESLTLISLAWRKGQLSRRQFHYVFTVGI